FPDELLPDCGIRQGFRRQVGEVDYLHAVLPQQVAEGVVLLLGDFQIGDIVEQQPPDGFGHEIFQLPARPVEEYPPERADFTADFNGRQAHTTSTFLIIAQRSRVSRFYVSKRENGLKPYALYRRAPPGAKNCSRPRPLVWGGNSLKRGGENQPLMLSQNFI